MPSIRHSKSSMEAVLKGGTQTRGPGGGYKPPVFDTSKLKFSDDAFKGLKGSDAFTGGGGGGGGGGRGGFEWEDTVKNGEKALDSVIKECLIQLALKMNDIVEKLKSLEEDDGIPLGTKRFLMKEAVENEGKKAIKDFGNCLQKKFGSFEGFVMSELRDELLGMARDDLMNRFGVNMTAVDIVFAKAERQSGGSNSRE